MNKVLIRIANEQNLPALRQLFLTARRQLFAHLDVQSFQLSDFDTQTVAETIWVACDETGALQGFISVYEPEDFIHHLFVAANAQRQGIGLQLLSALPAWGSRPYQLKCLLNNEAALAFYCACHFETIGRGTAEDGDYLLLQYVIDHEGIA